MGSFILIIIKTSLILVLVLIAVAIITLSERKLLGLLQIRKGPVKSFFKGFLQPISDLLKLFNKKNFFFKEESESKAITLTPFCLLILFIRFWGRLPLISDNNPPIVLLWFLLILGLNTYPLIMAGWYSNRKYRFISCYRSLGQIVSYELAIMIILLSLLLLTKDLNLRHKYILNILNYIPLLRTLLLTSVFIELNRTPFDIRESERELVSGFITEYGGILFRFFFLCEYGIIIFFGFFVRFLLRFKYHISILIIYLVIRVRGLLPRTRYDKQIKLAWKTILPRGLILILLSYITII